MNKQTINIDKVIKRLKEELNFRYDAELASEIGIESTYLGAMKSRGEFTGTAWNGILTLCNREQLNINSIVFGTIPAPQVKVKDFKIELKKIQKQVTTAIEKYK